MAKYAVVPTHDRPAELRDCLISLAGQVEEVFVIDNASDPPVPAEGFATDDFPLVTTLYHPQQPPNLSRLWNIGISAATHLDRFGIGDEPFIAILNDDTIVPPGWFDHVVGMMEATGAAAGCTSEHTDRQQLHTGEFRSVFDRLTGWAFILRGSLGIRADERLRWWYGDTAIDWEARREGGVVIGPGPIVLNRYPNASTTGLLAEQAGRDRATYLEHYGPVPW